MMMETIRILLADDHPAIRAGVAAILGAEPDMAVIGESAEGNEALHLARELQPDVLLLDLNMPGPVPLVMLNQLSESCPETKVLILTAYDDMAYIRGFIAAGASGYVLKEEPLEAVVDAIRAVVRGGSWFSRPIVEKLVAARQDESGPSRLSDLTKRERQVLQLMAHGLSNAQIAEELHLAEQTVANYASRIYSKLDVQTRPEAIVWARSWGLVEE